MLRNECNAMAPNAPSADLVNDDDPFNQYNTEIVKFDATNSTMMENGDLVKRAQDETNDAGEPMNECGLFVSNYELVGHLIPADSINVTYPPSTHKALASLARQPTTNDRPQYPILPMISGPEQVVHRCHLHCRAATAFEEIRWPSGAASHDFAR